MAKITKKEAKNAVEGKGTKERLNLSEEEIIAEIERLKVSPYVKIAKRYENEKLKQKLYQLRSLEKKGKEIAKILEKEDEE